MFSFGHCKKIWRGGGSCPNFFGTCFTKYSVSYISTSKSCRVYTFWSFVSYNCKIIKSTKIMTDGYQKFSGKSLLLLAKVTMNKGMDEPIIGVWFLWQLEN